MEGRCQCKAITFTTPSPSPIRVYICHCTECRHMSSSAFGISAMFPAFTLGASQADDLSTYKRPIPQGKSVKYFCRNCGSALMHQVELPSGEMGGMAMVKGGCLNGLTKEMMRGAVHIWTKSAVVDIPEGVEAYEMGPPDSHWKALQEASST